ncbi:nuclear receptor-binding factor 2 [Biomphalaria pfeifferi]|uniref:Nuclear receptor-binding factor 2 n=1 Tax=Biomphalaria pfeifferi TaxID=112525 RepID=A0AAD8FB88_BIOPF|nr:nuclear receptor-binding factor 2 [Biomphalaria pfeifferi]
MFSRDDGRPIVQAPMESPLNCAHTYSRRADMLSKNKNYEEAIVCHRKAADCLLQAMSSDTSSILLESLALQHKAYLSQIDRLHAKSELLELMNRNSKTTPSVSRSTQTDRLRILDTPESAACDEETICEILRENDDIMRRVSLRTVENGNLLNNSHKSSCISNDFFNDNKIDGDLCLSNMESPSLQEIVKLNNRLSSAVRSLLKELGSTKAEKKQMEEKLGESQELLGQGSGVLTFSSLTLPPLEVSYLELANSSLQT